MLTVQLWKDKEKKTIDPALFSERAETLSIQLAQECTDSKKKHNKRTQIRRFYDEVVRLNAEARSKDANWHEILPLVNMVVAKAAYAKGRDLVSDTFLNFVRDGVKQVQTPEDLNVFANFFEAFMGFYRMRCPK